MNVFHFCSVVLHDCQDQASVLTRTLCRKKLPDILIKGVVKRHTRMSISQKMVGTPKYRELLLEIENSAKKSLKKK